MRFSVTTLSKSAEGSANLLPSMTSRSYGPELIVEQHWLSIRKHKTKMDVVFQVRGSFISI
jgi:hypothetical protein